MISFYYLNPYCCLPSLLLYGTFNSYQKRAGDAYLGGVLGPRWRVQARCRHVSAANGLNLFNAAELGFGQQLKSERKEIWHKTEIFGADRTVVFKMAPPEIMALTRRESGASGDTKTKKQIMKQINQKDHFKFVSQWNINTSFRLRVFHFSFLFSCLTSYFVFYH